MHTVAGYLALLFAITDPLMASAAFVIKLKNGNEIITSRYWHEGKLVMFDTYGGIFGVENTFVTKIEVSDKPVRLVSALDERPAEKTQVSSPKIRGTGAQSANEQAKQVGSASDEAPVRDEEIIEEFGLLRGRSARLNDLSSDQLYRLSDDLNAFKRRILATNSVENYQDELGGANTLLGAVESLLRARTQ